MCDSAALYRAGRRPREVLDGALDPFLLAYLTQRNSGATVPTPETASVPASASDD